MSVPPSSPPPERRALLPLAATGVALALIAVGLGVVVGGPSGLRLDAHESSAGHSAEGAAREPDGGRDAESSSEREGEREGMALAGESGEAGERARATAERVQQNAYPAPYASAVAGLKARAATVALPEQLTAGDFRAQVSDPAARAQAGAPWDAVGPVGVVAPPTTFPQAPVVAGRVNAIAVDPHCGQAGYGCRLWAAHSGGGIWRTPDAMAGTPEWTFISGDIPTTVIGRLALDPNDATGNTLYAGTGDPNGFGNAGVGLYRSTDGGDHWSLVTGSRAYSMNRAIGGVAVKPGNPDVIVMGTSTAELGGGSVRGGAESPPNGPALGVYLTANGGGAFESFLPTTSRSTNPSFPSGGVVQMEFDPVNSSIVYASITGHGIYRYDNTGWNRIYQPADPNDIGSRAAFTLIKRGAQVHMYVLDGGFDTAGAVRRTLDAQAATPTWEAISNASVSSNLYGADKLCGFISGGSLSSQCWYDMSIAGAVSGGHDVVWIGGMAQYGEIGGVSNGRVVVRSANADAATGSVTWTDMSVGATTGPLVGSHPDQHAIALNPSNPDQAFLGSDGGLVRTDGGFSNASGDCSAPARSPLAGADLARCQQLLSAIPTAVTGINSNLATLEVVGVASPQGSANTLIAGFQDNGTAINGGAPAWTGVAGGDGGPPAFDRSGGEIAYQQYYSGALSVSYDSGAAGSFLTIDSPMQASGENVSFYAPLLADPVTAGTVFSGWEHVWRSTDRGGARAQLVANGCGSDSPSAPCGDFQAMGPNLTDAALGSRSAGDVSAIARGTGDTTTLWAATSSGRVFVSRNATAPAASVTFTRVDDDSAITPTRFPSSIQVDPTDPNHVWVAYAGYNANTPTTPGHLFEVRFNPSTGTSTWANRSYDLGDVPLRGMAYDPLLGDIYASGDWGVLRLPGGATAWMDAGAGMPRVATYGFAIQPAERVLYAATYGRGAYKLSLPSADPGPAPPAPMPGASTAAAAPARAATRALSARVVLPRNRRVTAGANGSFVIRLAPTSTSGTGTLTLTGALQPTSGRPTSARLAKVRYRFTRNHATNVTVRLPAGSRRLVARAGRMRVTAQVVMRSTTGEASSTTARLVLQASGRLRAASR